MSKYKVLTDSLRNSEGIPQEVGAIIDIDEFHVADWLLGAGMIEALESADNNLGVTIGAGEAV